MDWKTYVCVGRQTGFSWVNCLEDFLEESLKGEKIDDLAYFQLGTSSMNSKLTGEGAAADDDDDVKKKALQFSAINSDF